MGGLPEPATPPIAKVAGRTCAGCGCSIAWDVTECPHCGRDCRFVSHQITRSVRMGTGMKVLLFLASFFIPILGLIAGAYLYAYRKEDDYKRVGKICILISLVALALLLVCSLFWAGSPIDWSGDGNQAIRL